MDEAPLRDRPVLNESGSKSDTLFIQGLSRGPHESGDLLKMLSEIAPPVEVDFSRVSAAARPSTVGAHLWAKYASIDVADRSLRALNNRMFSGTYLSVRCELGIDRAGARVLRKADHHPTTIRKIATKNGNNTTKFRNSHDYSSHSVIVNNMEYPFPTGLYLARVIELQARLDARSPDDALCTEALLQFVSSLSCRAESPPVSRIVKYAPLESGRYAKELTEAMAMVDAVDRALRMLDIRSSCVPNTAHSSAAAEEIRPGGLTPAQRAVRVYVLGDGVYPLCTALIALHFPYASWEYYSIDPVLDPLELPPRVDFTSPQDENSLRNRFHQHSELSENFIIPLSHAETLSIVVSCHSHAPLQEFWGRLPQSTADGYIRTIVVSMPCCAKYGLLYEEDNCDNASVLALTTACSKAMSKKERRALNSKLVPLGPMLQFDDFEVYSPKRTVRIYAK